MKSQQVFLISTLALFLQLSSYQVNSQSKLREALTFYASFDDATSADFALGDPRIYTASASYVDSKRVLADVQVGMTNNNHRIANGKGKFGSAFEFGDRSKKVIYYKSKNNISYDAQNWSGSISFWLSVNPSTDLDGYTDPIQITDTNFNDASIWVDFTDHEPPNFRLGMIGDKRAWSQDTLNVPSQEVFEKRIVTIENPTFSRSFWTHIIITYENLGTTASIANLYLNGEKKGTVEGIDDPFTWEIEKSNIFLGLGFTGLLDELSIFNRSLTASEVSEIYQLKEGIKSLH